MLTLATKLPTPYNIWSRNIFPFSMEDCVFYAPLWQEDMQGSPILSYDQYHHSGAVTQAVWGQTGRTFDAVDDLINCGAGASLALLSPLSVIAWVNPTSVINLARILSKEAGWLFYYSTLNRFILQISHATSDVYRISANSFITTGSWQQIAGTWDGGLTASTAIKLYANAIESASYTNNNGTGARIDDTANSLIIGNVAAGTAPCDTIIGEVWIFKKVLTQAEIQRHYEITRGRYAV